jgi:hypothetical protein
VTSFESLQKSEPALLFGGLTGAGGLLAFLGANFSFTHSAGLAVGMATVQALLTRPTVVTSKSVDKIESSEESGDVLADVISAAAATPHPAEPAVTIGALVFLLAFIVQLFAGVEMTTAFASAAGLAGVQTVATRANVTSPANAKATAAGLLAIRSEREKSLAEIVGERKLKIH